MEWVLASATRSRVGQVQANSEWGLSSFTENIILNSYWDPRSRSIFATSSADDAILKSLNNVSEQKYPKSVNRKRKKGKNVPTEIY